MVPVVEIILLAMKSVVVTKQTRVPISDSLNASKLIPVLGKVAKMVNVLPVKVVAATVVVITAAATTAVETTAVVMMVAILHAPT